MTSQFKSGWLSFQYQTFSFLLKCPIGYLLSIPKYETSYCMFRGYHVMMVIAVVQESSTCRITYIFFSFFETFHITYWHCERQSQVGCFQVKSSINVFINRDLNLLFRKKLKTTVISYSLGVISDSLDLPLKGMFHTLGVDSFVSQSMALREDIAILSGLNLF